MFPFCFLLMCVAALLPSGESADAIIASHRRPSNLTEYYYIQAGGDNPYTWSCKSGQPLLHGQKNSPYWEVYSGYSLDDQHCLSQIVFGSTKARDYQGRRHDLSKDTYEYKIPVERFRSKKLIKTTPFGTKLIKVYPTLVRNKHNLRQEGVALGYSQSVSQSSSVTIGFSASVSASAKFKVPFVGETEFKVEVGASQDTTESTTTTKTIDAPAQRITLEPNTQATVTFRFYEAELRDDYLLEFEVDSKDEAFKLLKEQVEQGMNTKLSLGDGPYLRLDNGKWIAGGIPASETYTTHTSKVEFGEPMPVTNEDFELYFGPYIKVQDI